jgi:hypothetical protein
VPRLLFSTGTAVLVPLAVLGLHQAAAVWVTVLLVTVASAYYGNAIIGGVVGDYLGASIQVLPAANVGTRLATGNFQLSESAITSHLAPGVHSLSCGSARQCTRVILHAALPSVERQGDFALGEFMCVDTGIQECAHHQHMPAFALCCALTHCRSVS